MLVQHTVATSKAYSIFFTAYRDRKVSDTQMCPRMLGGALKSTHLGPEWLL